MGRANICVVDDDKIFQFTMKLSLKPLNNIGDVNYFNDGLEAIDFIIDCNVNDKNKMPDIIFLDINMPVMDGYQFIEDYRKISSKLDKTIKIHMLSSSIDPVDIEKVKNINEISSYITKPIEKGVLKSVFEDLKLN